MFSSCRLFFTSQNRQRLMQVGACRCYDGDLIYLWDCTLGELSYFRVENKRGWVAKLSNWDIIVSVKPFSETNRLTCLFVFYLKALDWKNFMAGGGGRQKV